jgi:hypothetical protein
MQDLFPHHVMTKGPVDHGHVLQIACHRAVIVKRVSWLVEVQMRSNLDGFPAEIVDDAVEDRWRQVVESLTARREGRSYDRCSGRPFRFFWRPSFAGDRKAILVRDDEMIRVGK